MTGAAAAVADNRATRPTVRPAVATFARKVLVMVPVL
jgi:hypothetical protein